jgi:hypothetical protein
VVSDEDVLVDALPDDELLPSLAVDCDVEEVVLAVELCDAALWASALMTLDSESELESDESLKSGFDCTIAPMRPWAL